MIWQEKVDHSYRPKCIKMFFQEIKNRLLNPPILHLPDYRGRFHLFSDTSKIAACSALYQIQNGTHKSIGYASKRLPPPPAMYSITELELLEKNANCSLEWYHNKWREKLEPPVGIKPDASQLPVECPNQRPQTLTAHPSIYFITYPSDLSV